VFKLEEVGLRVAGTDQQDVGVRFKVGSISVADPSQKMRLTACDFPHLGVEFPNAVLVGIGDGRLNLRGALLQNQVFVVDDLLLIDQLIFLTGTHSHLFYSWTPSTSTTNALVPLTFFILLPPRKTDKPPSLLKEIIMFVRG
jgi:hypothetical protein